MNANKIRGEFGEESVRKSLLRMGYTIVATNYRKRCGEVDIVAVHGETVVFVEVKTRKFGSVVDGEIAVNHEKRNKIVKTAKAFLDDFPMFSDMNVRFDVAEVVVTTDKVPQLIEVVYYEDAFDPAFL